MTAYGDLTTTLDTTDFARIGELPLEEWTFHMSLAYCGTLSESEWQGIHARVAQRVVPPVSETVSEVEFVWYQDGTEHTETIPLGGGRTV